MRPYNQIEWDARNWHGYTLIIITPQGGFRHPETVEFLPNGELDGTFIKKINQLTKTIEDQTTELGMLEKNLRLQNKRMRKGRKRKKKPKTLIKY